MAQGLGALALVPALGIAAGAVAIPCALAIILLMILGRETHGHDLRELERSTLNGASPEVASVGMD